MTPARIVVADDHTLVRAGVCKLLESMPAFKVIGQADNGRQVLELAEQLQPDLVLMDLSMPGLTGLEATARLRKSWPRIRVVILSMHQNTEYVRQALRNGASAYLLKDAAPQELEQALQTVLRGETYLSPAIAKSICAARTPLQAGPPTEQLTPRQIEVLRLVAQGFSTKEIARTLDLSVKTVDTHRTSLMKQLDIHEVTGLVRYAIRTGMIASGL